MFLHNPFPGAFGMDIGDLSIKLVQLEQKTTLKKKDSFTLKEMRSINLPPGYIVDGELQQPEMVRKKILHLLGKDVKNKKPIKSPWVAVNLPEPKSFIKLIKINIPPSELVEDDIKYHVKKHLLHEIEELHLDWQILNENEEVAKNSDVLIAAIPKVIADSYTYLLESVGLTPIALEIEAISIARSMVTAYKKYEGEARAILDLGATRSDLIIYDNKTIQFSNSLNFSGEILTTLISQKLNLSHEDAENLKIKNGLKHDPKHPKYLKIVSDSIENLGKEIEKSLIFYQNHFKNNNPIKHITMCGGAAALKNLDSALSKKLGIETATGHPWKNLRNKKSQEKNNLSDLSFASAIGLALRAAKNVTK